MVRCECNVPCDMLVIRVRICKRVWYLSPPGTPENDESRESLPSCIYYRRNKKKKWNNPREGCTLLRSAKRFVKPFCFFLYSRLAGERDFFALSILHIQLSPFYTDKEILYRGTRCIFNLWDNNGYSMCKTPYRPARCANLTYAVEKKISLRNLIT